MSRIMRRFESELPTRVIIPTEFTQRELDLSPEELLADDLAELILQKQALEAELESKRREFDKLEKELLQIVADAQDKALRLVEQAQSEAEHIRTQAADEGRGSGLAAGREEARAEVRQLSAEAHRVLEEAERERKKRIASSESFVIEMALKIAERIVERELTADDGYVESAVKRMLAEVDKAHRVEIRVAIMDFAAVVAQRNQFENLLFQRADCVIVPDLALSFGDVLIVTEYGTVNGRVSTRFDQLRQALMAVAKEWENHGPDNGPDATV